MATAAGDSGVGKSIMIDTTLSSLLHRPPKSPFSNRTTKQPPPVDSRQNNEHPNPNSKIPDQISLGPSNDPIGQLLQLDDGYYIEEMKVAVDEKSHSFPGTTTTNSPLPQTVTFDEEDGKEKAPPRRPSLSSSSSAKRSRGRGGGKPRKPSGLTRAQSVPTTFSQQADEALTRMADDCMKRGDYSTAIAMFQSIMKEQEATFGPGHYTLGDCLYRIGECCLLSSQFERALKCFEDAYSIKVSAFGSYHLSVAASLEKIGESMLRLNRVSDAHDAFRNALRVKQKVLGMDHTAVADLMSQMGWIYYHTGELMSSQAAFEDALMVYKMEASKAQQKARWLLASAEAISNIGSVQLKRASYASAASSFSEALMVS